MKLRKANLKHEPIYANVLECEHCPNNGHIGSQVNASGNPSFPKADFDIAGVAEAESDLSGIELTTRSGRLILPINWR